MASDTPIVNKKNTGPTQLHGSSDPGPAQNKRSTRPSKIRSHYVSRGSGNDIKRDIDQQLITTQAVTKDDELERRLDRIKDIGNMLEDNGAFSEAERQWLRNLHNTDKESFNKIGKLLSVPKYFSFRESRVKDLNDRNKIRMQTLKAVVHEAFKTAKNDDTAEKRKIAVVRAIDKATVVRKVLNSRYARTKRLRVYDMVSRETLQNPDILYKHNDDIVANLQLARKLIWPRKIHSKVRNQSSVAKAAKALIDNNLLDAKAADNLGKMLRTKEYGYDINVLMTIDHNDVPDRDDRKKIRSLLLAHLAYYKDPLYTAKVKNYLLQEVEVDTSKLSKEQQRWQPKYERIHQRMDYLPEGGRYIEDISNRWRDLIKELKPPKAPAKSSKPTLTDDPKRTPSKSNNANKANKTDENIDENAIVEEKPKESESLKVNSPDESNITNKTDKTDKEIDENIIIEEEPKASGTGDNVLAENAPDLTDQKIDESAIPKEELKASETDDNVPAKDIPAKKAASMTSEEIAREIVREIVGAMFKDEEEDETIQKVANSAHTDDVKKDDIDEAEKDKKIDETKKNKKTISLDPPDREIHETGDNVFTHHVAKQDAPIPDVTDSQNEAVFMVNRDNLTNENSDYRLSGDYFDPQDAYVDAPSNPQGTPESEKFRLASDDSDDQNDASSSSFESSDMSADDK